MAQPFRYVEKSVAWDVASWLRHDGGGRMIRGEDAAIHPGAGGRLRAGYLLDAESLGDIGSPPPEWRSHSATWEKMAA